MTPHESLYDHAGGDPAIHALEKAFYAKVLADPVLQLLFGAGRPQHVEHLTWFTSESFGGPDRFTRELGFQHLIDVHRHLHITEEQRERFVEAVRSHVEFGTGVAMQNSNAESEEELHPLREVPRWRWDGDR